MRRWTRRRWSSLSPSRHTAQIPIRRASCSSTRPCTRPTAGSRGAVVPSAADEEHNIFLSLFSSFLYRDDDNNNNNIKYTHTHDGGGGNKIFESLFVKRAYVTRVFLSKSFYSSFLLFVYAIEVHRIVYYN